MLCIPQVLGTVEVQISTDNITWMTVENASYGGTIDETAKIATVFQLKEETKYYLRAREVGITDWGYAEVFTEGDMAAAIAITMFVLAINIGMFWLSFREKLVENQYANFVLKRCCMIVGIYLVVMNSAIMASIAVKGGLEVTSELFLLMEYFGWAGYLAMLYLAFATAVQTIKTYYLDKKEQRTGAGNNEL